MRKKRGQSSVEYLSVVGIALMVLVPGSYLFLTYSKSTTDQVTSSQLNLLGTTLISEAEKMYVLGDYSWATLDMSFPGNINNVAINGNRELVFEYNTNKGKAQVVFFAERFNISNSSIPCVGSCSINIRPGTNRIKIQSRTDFVSLEII